MFIENSEIIFLEPNRNFSKSLSWHILVSMVHASFDSKYC